MPPVESYEKELSYLRGGALHKQTEITDAITNGIIENGQWIPGALFWATTFTQTFDEHWHDKQFSGPFRPFPRLPYMPFLFSRMATKPVLCVPKSREMMVSWALVAYAVWLCQEFPRTRVLIQSQKLDKASELVTGTEPPGYARTLWERQPEWLRFLHPLADRIDNLPADRLVWENGSAIQAVGQGANQIRMYHPTLFCIDEAAHLDEAEGSFGAALPVSRQIILVSSAGPGFFSDLCSRG